MSCLYLFQRVKTVQQVAPDGARNSSHDGIFYKQFRSYGADGKTHMERRNRYKEYT